MDKNIKAPTQTSDDNTGIIIKELEPQDEKIAANYSDVIVSLIKKLQTSNSTIPEYTYAVLTELLNRARDEDEHPTQKVIIALVRKVRYSINKGINVNDWQNDQSNVAHALTKWIKNDKIRKDEKMRYHWVDADFLKAQLRERIIAEVNFESNTLFPISNNTVIIEVNQDSFITAKKLLEQYLKESYYKILEHSGLLVLLLKGNKDELANIRKELRDIIKESYTAKHTPKKIKLKTKE